MLWVCVFADMGVGLYGASKFITTSDVITTVTPEKRTEEKRVEQGTDINQSMESSS